MENIRDIYDGILDAYDLIYPWIPSTFKHSIQANVDNIYVIAHTLFTNPSDLKFLIPSIISTLTFLVSVYWTVSSLYFAVRRGLRITLFLLKYGSIFALLLAGLGWTKMDPEEDERNFANAVAEGFSTVAQWANEAAQPRTPPGPNFLNTNSNSRKAPGKPWEKFGATSESDSDSPSSRSKSRSSRNRGGKRSSDSPLGDIDLSGVLSWVTGQGNGGGDGEDESLVGRTIREFWEKNPDAWADAAGILKGDRKGNDDGKWEPESL